MMMMELQKATAHVDVTSSGPEHRIPARRAGRARRAGGWRSR
jgi:hypothetical protein